MARLEVFLWGLGCSWDQCSQREGRRDQGKVVKNIERWVVCRNSSLGNIVWGRGLGYRALAIVVLYTYR